MPVVQSKRRKQIVHVNNKHNDEWNITDDFVDKVIKTWKK